MKAQYRFIYNRKNQLNKEGKALVQIEVYLNAKRKFLSTGVYLAPNEWNENRSEVTSANKNFIQLNSFLKQ